MNASINLMAPEVRANPYPVYAALRQAPICQVRLGDTDSPGVPGGIWAVSRYQDVLAVFRDPQAFSSTGLAMSFLPPWLPRNPVVDSLVMKDPPVHTRLRSLVQQAFAPPAMARLAPRIRAITEELASAAIQRIELDFVAAFSLQLPMRVLGLLYGMGKELLPRLAVWADDLLSIPGGQLSPARQDQIRASLADMERCMEELITEYQRSPVLGDDIMSLLVHAELAQQVTRSEILSFLFALVPAGMETTVHLLSNTMLVLSRHNEAQERVLKDPSLIPALIAEVLRYEPPGHSTVRLTTRDVELSGVTIPAGAMVVVLIAAALRDEEVFPQPDAFLLDRHRPSHLPFGHGIHYCLGHQLAGLEARFALEALLARIRGFTVTAAEIAWSPSLVARGPLALPLRLDPA